MVYVVTSGKYMSEGLIIILFILFNIELESARNCMDHANLFR